MKWKCIIKPNNNSVVKLRTTKLSSKLKHNIFIQVRILYRIIETSKFYHEVGLTAFKSKLEIISLMPLFLDSNIGSLGLTLFNED